MMTINKRILIVRTIGNAMVLGAFFGLLYSFWPVMSATAVHITQNLKGEKFAAAPTSTATQTFGGLMGKVDPNLKILIPKDPNFSLIVDKIGADAPIIANVDASDKAIYTAALKRGIAHALGTSFPGQPGVTYLFAHSTDTIFNVPRYNAVFYLLRELQPGDGIVLFFNGRRYNYRVVETKITEPEDVSYFTMQTNEQILVLQTCDPPGTTWKRLLVIAKPVSVTGERPNSNL